MDSYYNIVVSFLSVGDRARFAATCRQAAQIVSRVPLSSLVVTDANGLYRHAHRATALSIRKKEATCLFLPHTVSLELTYSCTQRIYATLLERVSLHDAPEVLTTLIAQLPPTVWELTLPECVYFAWHIDKPLTLPATVRRLVVNHCTLPWFTLDHVTDVHINCACPCGLGTVRRNTVPRNVQRLALTSALIDRNIPTHVASLQMDGCTYLETPIVSPHIQNLVWTNSNLIADDLARLPALASLRAVNIGNNETLQQLPPSFVDSLGRSRPWLSHVSLIHTGVPNQLGLLLDVFKGFEGDVWTGPLCRRPNGPNGPYRPIGLKHLAVDVRTCEDFEALQRLVSGPLGANLNRLEICCKLYGRADAIAVALKDSHVKELIVHHWSVFTASLPSGALRRLLPKTKVSVIRCRQGLAW